MTEQTFNMGAFKKLSQNAAMDKLASGKVAYSGWSSWNTERVQFLIDNAQTITESRIVNARITGAFDGTMRKTSAQRMIRYYVEDGEKHTSVLSMVGVECYSFDRAGVSVVLLLERGQCVILYSVDVTQA